MVDKIEITTGRELSKYLTGFSNSVDKLNRISTRFQNIKNNARNAGGLDGRHHEIKQFYQSLSRDLRGLSKEIANLNATDKMMAKHMKNISSGSGFANRMYANKISMPGSMNMLGRTPLGIGRQMSNPYDPTKIGLGKIMQDAERKSGLSRLNEKYRQPYNYDPYNRSTTQMHGAFRNAINPSITNAGDWLSRKRSVMGRMGSNVSDLTFNRDPDNRNKNNPTPFPATSIPSMFHTSMALGSNMKEFFGMGGGDKGGEDAEYSADGKKTGKGKKGIGGKIKGALKSPLGVLGGIGGAAMLGKKLIDSSPMLQAMMKMLNTTFTLILRPIGDFVGGMLRPITMFMLKEIAIPMAKKGKGFMKFGEEIGNKILGFFLRPIESIKAAIINAIYPMVKGTIFDTNSVKQDAKWAENYNGVTDWKLQKMIDNSEEGSEKQNTSKWLKDQQKLGNLSDEVINKSMDLLGGNVGSMGLDGSQAFGITAGGLESADEADQSIDEFLAFIQHMEASGQITSDEADQMSHWMKKAKNAGATTARNAIDMANIFGGANTAIQNKLKGLFKLQMSLAATARKNDNKGLSRKLKIKARDTNAMTTSLETAATGNFFGVNNAINSDPPPALSRIVKQRATNLRDYKDQKAAAATQSARNAAVKNALNPTNGLSFDSRSKKIWDEVKAGRMSQSQGKKIINGLAKEMIGSTNKLNIGYEGSKILDAYNEAKNNGTLGTEKQDQFRTDYSRASAQGDKQGQADAMNLLGQEGKTWEDYIAKEGSGIDKNTTWRDLKGMANGGVINEPILGIGRSGQGYQFGESGKEFVTPERKAGGTTFNVININVGNVNRDADFDKLKPLIQRWILESNSRRGMI